MSKQTEIEIKVGVFVALGLALVMASILILGSRDNLLSRKSHYYAHFPSVDGLISGAKVVIGGIHVGTVDKFQLDLEKREIRVDFSVSQESSKWIRENSTVEIATQGVLGDKYISITAGDVDKATVPTNSEIPNRPGKGLSQFLSKGDQLMVTLNSLSASLDRLLKTFEAGNRSEIFFQGLATTSKNMASASEKLNRELDDLRLKKVSRNLEGILEKINNGNGTLGALLNDPSLYDDAKKLVGEVNRNRIMRNLVRKTLKEAEQAEQKVQK
jgi:phospholipid/cholesterol/gamma-HCH transport system substrate-binding protein